MATTTADELLHEAHGALRRSLRSLPAKGPFSGRPMAAFTLARDALSGWPALAQAQAAVIRAAAVTPAQQERTAGVLAALDRISERDAPRAVRDVGEIGGVGEVDPTESLFARATDLTRAAADALHMTAPAPGFPRGSDGTIDAVLGGVATAAQVTGAYVDATFYQNLPVRVREQARGLGNARPWDNLVAAARTALASPHPQARSSEAGSVPIVATHEEGLAAALERWRHSAARASDPSIAPTADLPGVARALTDIHRAAWDAGIPGARAAGQLWRQSLTEGWGSTALRIPGPPDPELRAATRVLRDALEASAGELGTGRGPEAQALEGFIRSHGEHVTEKFSDQVRSVVGSEQIAVSARLLMSTLSRPYPVDVTMAGQRGRWVPLPAGSPPAQQLLDTTGAAQRATGEMVAGVRARDMHAHSFPTGRAFGQASSAVASPVLPPRGPRAEHEPDRGFDR